MLSQVIRKGDQVVFARAHEHPQSDQRSFVVEEVIPAGKEVAEARFEAPHARIVALDGDALLGARPKGEWIIRAVDALKHDLKDRKSVV